MCLHGAPVRESRVKAGGRCPGGDRAKELHVRRDSNVFPARRLQPSASYSFTMRLHLPQPGAAFALVAHAIAEAEAVLGAIDLVRVESNEVVRDVTVACVDSGHAGRSCGRCASSRACASTVTWSHGSGAPRRGDSRRAARARPSRWRSPAYSALPPHGIRLEREAAAAAGRAARRWLGPVPGPATRRPLGRRPRRAGRTRLVRAAPLWRLVVRGLEVPVAWVRATDLAAV